MEVVEVAMVDGRGAGETTSSRHWGVGGFWGVER